MNTKVKKFLGGAALGLALVTNTTPTWAGFKFNAEVHIANNVAQGSMTSARYSSDNVQYITCWTAAGGTNAFCTARDKTANSVLSCTTTNPYLVGRMAAITDSSFILFSTQSGSSECFTVYVDNASYNLR
jgi:hypothetical protein